MWLNVNVSTQSSPSRGEKVLCFELLHIVIPTGVTAIAGPAVWLRIEFVLLLLILSRRYINGGRLIEVTTMGELSLDGKVTTAAS